MKTELNVLAVLIAAVASVFVIQSAWACPAGAICCLGGKYGSACGEVQCGATGNLPCNCCYRGPNTWECVSGGCTGS